MTSPPPSPHLVKPLIPPLLKASFTRLAKPLVPLPKFAHSPCPFRPNHLPQLPSLNDHVLAAIITSEPQPLDDLGLDVQTWGDEKHTLLSLAERGFKFFESRVTERVQDLAPGPFKDREAIKAMIHTMVTVETLALLGCCYAFPKPSSEPSANRAGRAVDGVQHACDMFMAYIGALRVPYRQDERLATAILRGLDKYLDDLISPKVWIKLDDLVKARSRGERYGEQQLLNPQKRTLAERMTNNINPFHVMSGIERQVPSFTPNSPAFKHGSPSLLFSPASQTKPLRARPAPTGPRNALQPLRISVPTGPRNPIPPRHISPHTSNTVPSETGLGPKRSQQRSKRGNGGPMDQSQRGQGGQRLGIDPLDRWFER